ncbi:MAG TPA: GGDEF domain-containing protein, partial [Chloroflexota bacterium]
MRFSDLARPARVYVVSIVGLALLTAELTTWQGTPMASVELFSLLVLAATVAHSFPVSLPGKQAYHVSLPFFVAAVLLLAPLQLVALVATVHLVDWFKHRRSPVIQVFNTATFLLSGLLAQAMYRALWSGPDTPAVDLKQSACLVAGLAAVLTFGGLNRVLVSGIIWLGHKISPRNQHMFDAESLLTDGVLLLMGVPLAHQAQIAPWAAAAGAAPLWLIHRALDLPNVRAQSRRDGLTELFTAPYMIETCSRELNRALRFNRPVSLLLLDVDHLGDLNAEHGQQAGDAVLRGAARTICAGLREYDVPARMAGGLFAVLLPETDLAAAQGVAERIRRATAEERCEIPNSIEQAQATLSVGGCVVFDQNVTAAQFFDAARRALTRAKDDGGNHVEFETVAMSVAAASTQSSADEPRPAAGATEDGS